MNTNYHGYDETSRYRGDCWFTTTADRLNFCGFEVIPKVFDSARSMSKHLSLCIDKQIEYNEKFETLTATTAEAFRTLRLDRKNFSVIAWNGLESSHLFVVDSVVYLNEGYYNRFETQIDDDRVEKLLIQDMDRYIEDLKSPDVKKQMYDNVILVAAKRYAELHPDYDLDTILRIGLSSYIIPNNATPCDHELDFVEKVT